jgi:hypothetical protein
MEQNCWNKKDEKQKFCSSDFRSGLSAIAESCVFAGFLPNTGLELWQ